MPSSSSGNNRGQGFVRAFRERHLYSQRMPVTRHFLGWDRPLVEAVRDFLIPAVPAAPVELEADLIIVPTRQAGRRLTDELALYCGQAGTALLSCRVVTPAVLLGSADGGLPVASSLDVQQCWIEVLGAVDTTSLNGLFPSPPAEVDAEWSLRFAATIEDLRRSLLDAGLTIGHLVATRADDLTELDRWQDLAQLESAYLETLEQAGLQDPCVRQLTAAENPEVDDKVRRIVVAGVPDPSEPALRVLRTLADTIAVQVLIAAPTEHADDFDEWGRPLPSTWCTCNVAFPNPDGQIVLAATPADQAEAAIDLLEQQAGQDGQPAAIGTPDRGLIPYLQSALSRRDCTAFDPADKPLRDHPLFLLVEAYVNLATDKSYTSLARLLRQPELLARIEHDQSGATESLLRELDDLQNERIPWDLGAVRHWLTAADPASPLRTTIDWLADLLPGRDDRLSAAIRAFLQAILQHRTITAGQPDDDEFERAARSIDEVLHELADMEARTTLPLRSSALLLIRRLGEQQVHRERDPAAIDLDGWLELPWNPAPALIVTGVNEGIVPASASDNAFLTDSLRTTLGMRNDADGLARDTFLLQVMIESRREAGGLWLITGKVSDTGDPLRPSRLLLRCPDSELPSRAERLFREVSARRTRPASRTSFPLDPVPPPDIPSERHIPSTISVTAFRDYLTCPFRFYLKRVLGMEARDDHKRAPDALDFGIMVHDALQRMGEDKALRTCTDARVLTDFLTRQAEHWVKKQYGAAPALPIRMALHAAQQRLEAAACVQASLAAEGWEIVEAEQAFKREIGGLIVRGKIDRIDRHRDTGAIRVIDYKTRDSSESPIKAHLGSVSDNTPEYATVTVSGKAKRWIDLQLPLYAVLGVEPSDSPPEPAYFDLPRAVSETSLQAWESFDADLAAAAFECAEAIAEQVRAGTFWPPAERVTYDDFEALFHDGLNGWKKLTTQNPELTT